MSLILVHGAAGAQARPVAEQLLAAGHRVRLLVRRPEAVADLAARGAEIARGDLADPDSLAAAHVGIEGVFLLLPFFDPQISHAVHAIDAARNAGVRQIVWNTTGTIPPLRTGNPGVDIRLDILALLRASTIPFVALQPTAYMENLLGPWTAAEVAEKDQLAYPIPNSVTLQWISHQDAAAFAVAAFARLPEGEHLIEICGPETLTGEAMAARFTTALGRPIHFRPMPPREFGALLDRVFGGGGDAIATFYESVHENPAILSTAIDYEALQKILPIEATNLETFARRHRSAFTNNQNSTGAAA